VRLWWRRLYRFEVSRIPCNVVMIREKTKSSTIWIGGSPQDMILDEFKLPLSQ
jgi:hypothetical protein